MSRDLPSLNAVRMFEAAAHHRNFTRAAEQLFVTQGAVSRQIKRLEQDLNQMLFLRDGPKLELTNAGDRFYKAVAEGLGIIRRSTLEMKRLSAIPTLTISVLPFFAANWLVPRMVEFQRENDNIELRIAASYEPVDFLRRPDIDVAIRFGTGHWQGIYSECLINEQIFPVCSPVFLTRAKGLQQPEDLLRFQLIYADNDNDQWDHWFEAAHISPPTDQSGPRYSNELLLHQAAIKGQGITLARSLLVADEIQAGRLVRLFDISVTSTNSYYFVCSAGRETEENIQLLLLWLRQAALQSNSACVNLCESP
jgi:LysR family glycine cleavage system transcriptional activator